jgi:hypothetical protein
MVPSAGWFLEADHQPPLPKPIGREHAFIPFMVILILIDEIILFN